MLQGKRHGPYASQRAAIEDAIRGAQTVPGSQVLVETADNQVRAEWTHGSEFRPSNPHNDASIHPILLAIIYLTKQSP